MKKLALTLSILFAAVSCTACINNLAIQELNNKAQEYMKAGDTQSAICRLKSSLDLDSNFFETNYNLAIAYIEEKDWENAHIYLENAIKINPAFPDSYYSLGYIYENLADDIIASTKKLDTAEKNADFDAEVSEPAELTDDQKTQILDYYKKSIEAYNKFIDNTPDARAKEDAKRAVASVERETSKYLNEAVTE